MNLFAVLAALASLVLGLGCYAAREEHCWLGQASALYMVAAAAAVLGQVAGPLFSVIGALLSIIATAQLVAVISGNAPPD